MNRGQRRAQWRNRIRRENAAGLATPRAVCSRMPDAGLPARAGHPATTCLRIHELVLRGFDRGLSRRIAAAFERELTALLQAHGLPAQWRGNVPRAHTSPVRPNSFTDARGVGEQVARAVFSLRADSHRAEAKR